MANMRVIQATHYSLHKNLSCLCTYSLCKLCIAHCACKLNANKCDIFEQYCSYIFITGIILMNFIDAAINKIDKIIILHLQLTSQLKQKPIYMCRPSNIAVYFKITLFISTQIELEECIKHNLHMHMSKLIVYIGKEYQLANSYARQLIIQSS